MNALEIKGLTKKFPDFTLDNLNLSLPAGTILGLIGENGAGKSTTIKLILGMLRADSGSISIFDKNTNKDIHLLKEDIGVVLDEVGLPHSLKPSQINKIMKYTYKNWNPDLYEELLHKFYLKDNKPFKDFSRGMQMKLGIAIAMAHDAKLLLLDEATTGLDPVVREEVIEMLFDFTRDESHSVLMSSHIVSDIEKLCDYVGFLHHGKLLLLEEKDVLLEKYGILHCTSEQLEELDENAVKYKKQTPYGVDAMVLRDGVPIGTDISPISIEELFLYMIKEAA